MNSKISLNELTDLLSDSAKISKKEANAFLKTLFDAIETNLITDKLVKIKGLGTFKLIWVENRRIANVNTGEIQEIPGHYKTTFTPDADLAEAVNEPFAHLDTIVLDDEIIADKPIDPIDDYLNELKNRPELQPEPDAASADSDEDEQPEETYEQDEEPVTSIFAQTDPTGGYQLSQAQEVSMPEEEQTEPEAPAEETTENGQTETETEKPATEPIPDAHLPYTPPAFVESENEQEPTASREWSYEERYEEEKAETAIGETETIDADATEQKNKEKEDEEDEEDEEEEKKRSSSYRWIIWMIVAAVAGIGGFFGYTYLYGLFPFEKTPEQENAVIIAPVPVVRDTTAIQTQAASDTTTKSDTAQATANRPTEPKRKTIAETIEERQKAVREGKQTENQNKSVLATEKMVVGSRLTKFALKYYGSRIFWVYIYEANKSKIDDPNNVPIGTVLDIPDKSVYQIDKDNPESVKRANKLAETILNTKP